MWIRVMRLTKGQGRRVSSDEDWHITLMLKFSAWLGSGRWFRFSMVELIPGEKYRVDGYKGVHCLGFCSAFRVTTTGSLYVPRRWGM